MTAALFHGASLNSYFFAVSLLRCLLSSRIFPPGKFPLTCLLWDVVFRLAPLSRNGHTPHPFFLLPCLFFRFGKGLRPSRVFPQKQKIFSSPAFFFFLLEEFFGGGFFGLGPFPLRVSCSCGSLFPFCEAPPPPLQHE